MKYFGTDGIRREAEFFTTEFLGKVVLGLVKYGREKVGEGMKVLIGGDTRESSEWILKDIGVALESLGVEFSSVGVLPTPAINYCFYEMGFDFAIDVTASHNPYADNGLKIFERGEGFGVKLCGAGCEVIEKVIDDSEALELVGESLCEDLHDEAVKLYREHLINYAGGARFDGLRIGMDCANGATSVVNKTALEALGAEVVLINADENYGQKINRGCGSTHIERLRDLVLKEKLDFGVAFDGDGDRSLFIDENGELVDGDQIIAIVAKARGLDTVAVTVMTNQGLLNWAKDSGVKVEITAVGDHNVSEAMIEKKILVGGEQNGHIILPGMTSGDGLLAAVEVARIVKTSGESLASLAKIMQKLPQVIVNLDATDEMKARMKDAKIVAILDEYEEKMNQNCGRILVRPSGTEKIIRITIWGENEQEISETAHELAKKLAEELKK